MASSTRPNVQDPNSDEIMHDIFRRLSLINPEQADPQATGAPDTDDPFYDGPGAAPAVSGDHHASSAGSAVRDDRPVQVPAFAPSISSTFISSSADQRTGQADNSLPLWIGPELTELLQGPHQVASSQVASSQTVSSEATSPHVASARVASAQVITSQAASSPVASAHIDLAQPHQVISSPRTSAHIEPAHAGPSRAASFQAVRPQVAASQTSRPQVASAQTARPQVTFSQINPRQVSAPQPTRPGQAASIMRSNSEPSVEKIFKHLKDRDQAIVLHVLPLDVINAQRTERSRPPLEVVSVEEITNQYRLTESLERCRGMLEYLYRGYADGAAHLIDIAIQYLIKWNRPEPIAIIEERLVRLYEAYEAQYQQPEQQSHDQHQSGEWETIEEGSNDDEKSEHAAAEPAVPATEFDPQAVTFNMAHTEPSDRWKSRSVRVRPTRQETAQMPGMDTSRTLYANEPNRHPYAYASQPAQGQIPHDMHGKPVALPPGFPMEALNEPVPDRHTFKICPGLKIHAQHEAYKARMEREARASRGLPAAGPGRGKPVTDEQRKDEDAVREMSQDLTEEQSELRGFSEILSELEDIQREEAEAEAQKTPTGKAKGGPPSASSSSMSRLLKGGSKGSPKQR